MPNPNTLALIVSKISAFIRTDEQTDETNTFQLKFDLRFKRYGRYFQLNFLSSMTAPQVWAVCGR